MTSPGLVPPPPCPTRSRSSLSKRMRGSSRPAHGNLDDLAVFRRDDVLLADDVAEVLLDDLFDLLVVALAVAFGAAVQVPGIGA